MVPIWKLVVQKSTNSPLLNVTRDFGNGFFVLYGKMDESFAAGLLASTEEGGRRWLKRY
jgi:hypothetical protein